MDIETFDQLFAAESLALGAEVRGREVLPLLSGDLRPEMVEALTRVKARFKTGCITNNLPANAIGSHSGRSLYVAEVMALFDHIIESAKIGLRKPDPRIYRMMVETLGVDPKRLRLSRRSRRQPEAGARHGHDHDQGRQCAAGDRRTRGGDGTGRCASAGAVASPAIEAFGVGAIHRSAAAMLPPSTVVTSAVVFSASACARNACATSSAATSRPSRLPRI